MGKLRGRYRNQTLELDEPLNIPEGTEVEVEVSPVSHSAESVAFGINTGPNERQPAWAAPTAARLRELLRLPPNWDSYDARPIDPDCVRSLWNLLTAALPAMAPTPAVFPTPRGGVHVEWNVEGKDLEIEVRAPDQFALLFEDAKTGESTERELGFEPQVVAAYVTRLRPVNQP